MPNAIVLMPLARTSPTVWSHMRLCRLRGMLASAHAVDKWVLHDPRIWLGTAFHRVMEAAARPGPHAESADAVWQSAVNESAVAAAQHPLNSRFSVPERWPGYFLIRQRALTSAAAVGKVGVRRTATGHSPRQTRGSERGLETRDGRLAGRPDHFDGRTITEYKSSLPDPSWPGAQEVLDGYRRQLRLYAAIIADVEGSWPAKGRIAAASGQVMEVKLHSSRRNVQPKLRPP